MHSMHTQLTWANENRQPCLLEQGPTASLIRKLAGSTHFYDIKVITFIFTSYSMELRQTNF